MDEALKALVSQGVLGAVVVILGTAYWRQNGLLNSIYEKRIADIQQLQKETLTAIQGITHALERLTDLLEARK